MENYTVRLSICGKEQANIEKTFNYYLLNKYESVFFSNVPTVTLAALYKIPTYARI